jgi:hypothetical protein
MADSSLQHAEVSDNHSVVFREVDFTRTQWSLQVLDVQTGVKKVLADSSAPFIVLKKSNLVLMGGQAPVLGSASPSLRIYDLITKSWKELAIKANADCRLSLLGTHVRALLDEKYLLSRISCGADSYSDLIMLSLADGSIKSNLGRNRVLAWRSPDENWIITTEQEVVDPVSGAKSYPNPMVHHVETGRSLSIPINPHFGPENAQERISVLGRGVQLVAIASNRIYGFAGTWDKPIFRSVDLTSGISEAACETVKGRKVHLGSLPDQRVFLFTKETELDLFHFYQIKSPGECIRLNEFPGRNPYIPSLQATDSGFAVTISPSSINNVEEVVFVPVDGRPPVKINPSSGASWRVQISPDLKRVFFSGPSTGSSRLYYFELH